MNSVHPVFFYVFGFAFCYIFAVFVYILFIVASPIVAYLGAKKELTLEETKYCVLSTYLLHKDIVEREQEEDDDGDDDEDDDEWDTYSDDDDDTSEQWNK